MKMQCVYILPATDKVNTYRVKLSVALATLPQGQRRKKKDVFFRATVFSLNFDPSLCRHFVQMRRKSTDASLGQVWTTSSSLSSSELPYVMIVVFLAVFTELLPSHALLTFQRAWADRKGRVALPPPGAFWLDSPRDLGERPPGSGDAHFCWLLTAETNMWVQV